MLIYNILNKIQPYFLKQKYYEKGTIVLHFCKSP